MPECPSNFRSIGNDQGSLLLRHGRIYCLFLNDTDLFLILLEPYNLSYTCNIQILMLKKTMHVCVIAIAIVQTF